MDFQVSRLGGKKKKSFPHIIVVVDKWRKRKN